MDHAEAWDKLYAHVQAKKAGLEQEFDRKPSAFTRGTVAAVDQVRAYMNDLDRQIIKSAVEDKDEAEPSNPPWATFTQKFVKPGSQKSNRRWDLVVEDDSAGDLFDQLVELVKRYEAKLAAVDGERLKRGEIDLIAFLKAHGGSSRWDAVLEDVRQDLPDGWVQT